MDISAISLITFDASSSLLDWRKILEPILSSDQIHNLLKLQDFNTIHREFLRTAKVAFYEDVRHLSFLRMRFRIGCIGAGGQNFSTTLANQLGLGWDISVMSDESSASHHDENFWELARKRVRNELGIEPHQWLHVTADSGESISIAKNQGIQVCYVPRPMIGSATDADARRPELMVSDLSQLEFGLMQTSTFPVRYRVTANCIYAKAAREFINWMRREHGEELLQIPGCQEFRVLQLAPQVICAEYVFRDRAALDDYLANDAARLRAKGLENFPPEIVQFEREIVPILAAGSVRKNSDYRERP